jgi:hypothetical protein
METSEIEKHMNEFEKSMDIESYLLKYPVDMLMDFNVENIKEKLKDNPKQLYNFQILYLKAKAKVIELEDLYQEVISEQFDWYKFEYDRSLSTLEIKEFYIHKDPKVKQIKRLLDKQKIQKNFFQLCIESFKNQGDRMHDFVKV